MGMSMTFKIDYFYVAKMVSVKQHQPNDSSPLIPPLFSVYIVRFTVLGRTHFYRRPTVVPLIFFYIF